VIVNDGRVHPPGLHPFHGILLAATVPLFLGGLLSDLAYASSYQIQWSNFASWLIVGGLVFGSGALLWALANLIFARPRRNYSSLYTALLATTWVLGLFNSLIHAKDAWATMPAGLVLSVIVVLLACASTWVGFVKCGPGGRG